MIRKILCPTDFSSASNNAVEYAAKLAQQTSATLTLLHVQPIAIGEGINVFAGGQRESVAEARAATEHMEAICLELNKEFNVSCTHEIAATTLESFEKTIADESAGFDLTILGTNGADSLSQYYFGSHSFRVAKKETGPVLIVPENCTFQGIANLAFASNSPDPAKMSVRQLKQFTDIFNPELRAVYISEKESESTKNAYVTFCNFLDEALNYGNKIIFEQVFHSNAEEAVEKFMIKTNADLLALHMEEHNFLYNVFHEDVIRKIVSNAEFPVLVVHG